VNSLFARQIAKATKPCGGVDLDVLGQLVSAPMNRPIMTGGAPIVRSR
jgi:hypothetical protein